MVVRVVVIAADPGYEPRHDAFDYDRHGRAIAAGEGYPESAYVPDGGPTALRTPAYPFVLGAVYALAGDDPDAGRVAGALLGAGTAVFVWLIASWIWGRRTGLVAGALTAVYPPLVLVSRELFAESLFILLVPAIVACLIAFRRAGGTLRWAAAAGALCGLATLTVKSGAVLVIPAALAVWPLRSRPRGRALVAPATLALCTALVVAPWALRNAVEFGRFIPISSSTGFALAGTYNDTSRGDDLHPAAWRTPTIVPEYEPLFQVEGVDEGTLDATLRREATDFALDHPGYVAEVVGRNLLRLFLISGDSVVAFDEIVDQTGIGNRSSTVETVSFAIAVGLAVVGVMAIVLPRLRANGDDGAVRSRIPTGPWYLWLFPAVLIALAVPVAGLPRYRLPADPFLLMLAAVGAVWAWDWLTARRRRARRAPLVATLLLCGLTFTACSDDDDGPVAEPTKLEAVDADYAEKANAICRQTLRETRELGARALAQGPVEGGSPLHLTTDALVEPGLEIRERQAERLRGLPPPSEGEEALQRYVDLFGPTEELIRQRLEAGRAGDAAAAEELEALLLELGREQRLAARRAGLRDCASDFVLTAFEQPK